MIQIIACCDISICTAEDGLHGGIGIAFYQNEICDESLVREISEYRRVTKYDTHDLEWRAIHHTLKEITKLCEDQHSTVMICSDSEQAVIRWQASADRPLDQRLKIFGTLAAKSMNVRFRHVDRRQVYRAHCLAKCAAISQFTTAQAQNTRRQLAEALKR